MRISTVFLVVLILFGGNVPAQAYDSTPTKVIVYKNGLAWITEEGRGKTQNEWIDTRLHARPVLGTLRFTGKGDAKVLERVAVPSVADPTQRTLLALESNLLGQEIWVESDGKTLKGIYLGLASGIAGSRAIVMETRDGIRYLPMGKVDRVESNVSTASTLDNGAAEDTIRLRLSQKQGSYHLTANYLTQAIGWIPTYQLDIHGKNKGTMSLEAVLINDALDLPSVEIQFATGEASFPMQQFVSPLFEPTTNVRWVMDTVMGNVRGGFSGLDNNNPMSNAMNMMPAQQMVMNDGWDSGGGRSSGEETHLYGPVQMALNKGERAVIPLGDKAVPAKFVYHYKAPEQVTNAPAQNSVHLAALIVNKFAFPLTTGPVLVTKKGRPTGQGFITFTHEGGECLVPISIASSVLATTAEQELDRVAKDLTFRGGKYDKVIVKGTIQVENLQDRKVTVRLEKPLRGKVRASSHDGKTNEQFTSAYDPNPTSTVHWTIEAEPGKKISVTYEYQFYVQRHHSKSW